MPTPRFALIPVLLASFIPAAPATAFVLCKGKKGAVVVRETCKRRETRLDAVTVGTKGDAGTPGPGFLIVDRDGKEVGRVLGASSGRANVIREIDGMQFSIFGISDRGFAPLADNDSFLVYANADCTGPQYLLLFSSEEPMTRLMNVSIDGRTAYYALESERRFLDSSYSVSPEFGANDTAAATACTTGRAGKVMKEAHDCAVQFSPSLTRCVWCCEDRFFKLAAPAHTIDLQSLGLTPPFAMQGQ